MINSGFDETKKELREEFRGEIRGVRNEIKGVKNEIKGVKTELTTEIRKTELKIHDHIDEKLVETKGDIIIAMRKEDQKVNGLVKLLRKKNILSKEEVEKFLNKKPFSLVGAR